MGSFALRMSAHQKVHGEPLPYAERPRTIRIGFASSVPIKIEVHPSGETAVAKVLVGAKVLLAIDDRDGGRKIAVVSEAREFVGWLPSDDPIVLRLLDHARYRASLRKVLRGRDGRRFGAAIIEVGIEEDAMELPLG